MSGQSFAGVLDKGLAGGGTKFPERGLGDVANVLLQGFLCRQPAVFSTSIRPQIIGRGRVPGRHVDSVGHVSDRYFILRPVGKERLEDVPAHLPVQATHAVDRPAPADGQIGHVETLGRVVWVLAAQGQQIVNGNAQLFLGVPTEVLLDHHRIEPVKAGGHGRVGGEKIPRARDGESNLERLPGLGHERPGSFQDGERRMPFVQMTDFRLESPAQPAAASRQSQAAVLAGDAAPVRRHTTRW